MIKSRRLVLSLLASATILSGCSLFDSDDDKVPLPGERISVLQLQKNLEAPDAASETSSFAAPKIWDNEFWPQVGGYPNHAMQNLALNPGELKEIWSADIGEGNQDDLPLISQPVVFNNRIYTLDTKAQVSAFDLKTGKEIWRRSVKPKREGDDVVPGGVAYSNGLLYVTSGYNEFFALDPATGKTSWRAKLGSPSRAAPTILNNRAYVVTVDNKIIAFDAVNGTQLWDFQALSEAAGIVGAASPAAAAEVVIPAFSSGEIMALRVENGSTVWSDDLSPTTSIGGLTALPDIQGLPVIDDNMVFAISFGGRMVALNLVSGERVWQKDLSGAETPWVAGNYVFVLTSDNELLALSRDTGALRWVRPLASYIKEKAGSQGLLWSGPVMAGNRLILTGPEGNVLEVDPANGNVLRRMKLGKNVAVSPVVVGNTLLLLTEDGTLHAFQ